MTAQTDPYVRVYYSIITDDRFQGIYGNERTLGTWLRLLLVSDAMWPAPAPIPRSCAKRDLEALVAAGLVERLPDDHFRMHGLDAERSRRKEAAAIGGHARSANAQRLLSERSPNGNHSGSLSEPRRTETNRTTHNAREFWEEGQTDETEALQYLARKQCHIGAPGNGLHRKLIELVNRHGMNAVIGTFDRLGTERTLDARGYIFGASNVLDPIPTGKEEGKADREAEERESLRRRTEATSRYLDAQQRTGEVA